MAQSEGYSVEQINIHTILVLKLLIGFDTLTKLGTNSSGSDPLLYFHLHRVPITNPSYYRSKRHYLFMPNTKVKMFLI